MIADRLQVIDIVLKTIHMRYGKIGNAARTPGASVAALIIGDDGKTLMQEGKDQLRILEGILGEAVNDDHGRYGILRGIGSAPERPAVSARDFRDGFPDFQPGEYLPVHGSGIVF